MSTGDMKMCVVLNRVLREDPGRAINVAGHAMAGLVAKAASQSPERFRAMEFIDYPDASGVSHDYISAHGLIVLSAKAGQLHTLRRVFNQLDVVSVDFCAAMIDGTTAEQLARVAATTTNDLEPLCVAVFGPAEIIDPHTRRLSLWR
ncbi:DUF2000 domain-containing protein [Nocardia sp. NPDC048505]|uniref:DUF2000 domain-containing protein n=1 Tax=unclassified Nocardia TaxID=2637762 RepID=UPI0033C695DC